MRILPLLLIASLFCGGRVSEAQAQVQRIQVIRTMRRALSPVTSPTTQATEAPVEAGHDHDHSHETDEEREKREEKDPQLKLDRLEKQYELVRRLAAHRDGAEYQAEDHAGRVLAVLDRLEFGVLYDGTPEGKRYLVARANVINRTEEPIQVASKSWKLNFEGAVREQSELTDQTRNQSIQIAAHRYISLSDLKRPETLDVPAGQAGTTWVFFYDLPIGSSFPKSAVLLDRAPQPLTLDLKEQTAALLGLETERIGPSQALAVFHIAGQLNYASMVLLADALDKLSDAKVSRVVLHWRKGAPQIDSNLSYPLFNYATQSGRGTNHHDQRIPVLPNSLREIHLAQLPEGQSYSSSGAKQVVHKTLDDAVAAALWTALEILPEDALLKEIHEGHPLVRPAALSAGAARMSRTHLPLILALLADDMQPSMQQAAVYALRHFGDAEAVDALVGLVRDRESPLSTLAIASLASSRFESARDALGEMLTGDDVELKKTILTEIAKAAMPVWADLYYENVRDPESAIRVESLRALSRVGHDRLTDLLKAALQDENEQLREAAFEIALERREPELEATLEAIVLARLQDGPPQGQLYNYLQTTRNPHAIPVLLKQLQDAGKDQSQRQTLIQLLSEIGDDRVVEVFCKLYPDLSNYEKGRVLNALVQFESPRFLEFAREALFSKDSSQIHAAINGLQMTDSPDAEGLLIEAFDKIEETGYVDNLANALAQIGSVRAEEALRAARQSETPERRRAAVQGLRYLQQRRPGNQYVNQCVMYMRQKKWQEALDSCEFAVDIDADFALAYACRGTVLLHMNSADKPGEELDKSTTAAAAAFQKATKLDDTIAEAAVGLCRTTIRKGEVDEGLAALKKAAEQFQEDAQFEFHAALALTDAIAVLRRQPESAEVQQQIATCEAEALQHLSQCFKLGFGDRQLVQASPELELLSKHVDFQKALLGTLPAADTADDAPAQGEEQTDAARINQGKVIQASRVIMLPAPPERR